MKASNLNFHHAVLQIERQLWKAGSAIALVKVLWEYVQTLTEEQKASDFLASVKDAAWTTAVVKTYVLLEDKQSVTMPFLIEKLGAQVNPMSNPKAPFLSAQVRANLTAEVKMLMPKVKHIKDLRNNEEAHTSGTYSPKRVFEGKSKAEPEVTEVYYGCLNIMGKLYKELKRNGPKRRDFERGIKTDMLKRLVKP